MRFSVVIPAYQAAEKLPLALDSVFAQTCRALETIVVDDASPALPASDVLERYPLPVASGQLRVISLPENAGPSRARNTGWDAATGEYVAFLDADDRWDPDRLATIQSWLEADPQIDWLAHTYRLPGELSGTEPRLEGCPRPLTLSRLLLRNIAQTSCVVVRSSISERFDERMRHSEDYDLWLRLAAGGSRLAFADLALTELDRPQLSAGGLSANRWAMRRGEWRAYRHVARLRPLLKPALPFLYVYSFLKHARRAILTG